MPRCHSLVSCRACSGATTDVSNGSADWLRWRARLSVSSTRRRCSSRRADQYRRPGHRPLGRVTAPPPPSAIPLVSFERRFSSTFRTGSPPSPPFRFCPPALERPLLASVRRRSEPPPPHDRRGGARLRLSSFTFSSALCWTCCSATATTSRGSFHRRIRARLPFPRPRRRRRGVELEPRPPTDAISFLAQPLPAVFCFFGTVSLF